eukprot:10892761-Alexandrium_andersonii.AAC.1
MRGGPHSQGASLGGHRVLQAGLAGRREGGALGGARMQLRDAPKMLPQLPEDQLSGVLASFAEE